MKYVAGYAVGCKRISTDKDFALIHRLSSQRPTNLPFGEGDFALFTIEGLHYLGLITDLNEDEQECDVTLLTPNLPATIFQFPDSLLSFIVPFPHILCPVTLQEMPENKYEISKSDLNTVKLLTMAR